MVEGAVGGEGWFGGEESEQGRGSDGLSSRRETRIEAFWCRQLAGGEAAESVGSGLGAIRVKVAVEGIHRGFENQAAVGAGFKVTPDFGLDGRG